MNSGQTLLTLAAFALLMTVTLNMLRSTQSNGETILRSKCGLAAISLATSIIEEAQGKRFDEFTTVDPLGNDSAASSLTQLSQPNALGMNPNDTTLDDFDDYNNYNPVFFLELPDTFYVLCKVVYVTPTSPDVVSAARTWNKKLTVKVISPSLKTDTVKMDYVYSYWYFR